MNKADLIVSTLVLFEIEDLELMVNILSELNRVLDSKGSAIFVTGSEKMHFNKWYSIEPLHGPGKKLNSGDKVSILLKPNNIKLVDVFWKNKDYLYAFEKAGFECIKTHYSTANSNEVERVNEKIISPYVLYKLIKK